MAGWHHILLSQTESCCQMKGWTGSLESKNFWQLVKYGWKRKQELPSPPKVMYYVTSLFSSHWVSLSQTYMIWSTIVYSNCQYFLQQKTSLNAKIFIKTDVAFLEFFEKPWLTNTFKNYWAFLKLSPSPPCPQFSVSTRADKVTRPLSKELRLQL